MSVSAPIFASELSAARLLDMQLEEFRALVQAGHLPRGRQIAPGVHRWSTEELRRIASGEAAEGMGGVQW